MKKVYWLALSVLTLTVNGSFAEEAAAPDDKAASKTETVAPKNEKNLVVEDMTIVGTVTKCGNKKKDGTPMMTWYTLVDEEGKDVRLPKGKVEEFEGAKVKVTGTGYTIEKKGKTVRAFKTVTNIEKVATPATK